MNTKGPVLGGVTCLAFGMVTTVVTLFVQVVLLSYASLMGVLDSGPPAAAGLTADSPVPVPTVLWQGFTVAGLCLLGSTVCFGEATRRKVTGRSREWAH